MSILISVVICTRNRAGLLAVALESVCRQTLDASLYEVIVVDNGSVDGTQGVVEEWRLKFPNVRYCLEPRPGLSHARNRGWKDAKGEYVGYLDDDGKAPPEWLEVAREILAERKPAAFGGPYYACYASTKPKWWKDAYRSFRHGDEARPLGEREYVSGGNLFLRREILDATGGFDPALGMTGRRISVGEETRLLRDIRFRWPDSVIYYDPRLYIHHLVHSAKMRWRWLVRYWFAGGRDCWRIARDTAPAERRRDLLAEAYRTLVELVKSVLRAALKRDRRRYPYFQNYLFEVTSKHVIALGGICERFSRSRPQLTKREVGEG